MEPLLKTLIPVGRQIAKRYPERLETPGEIHDYLDVLNAMADEEEEVMRNEMPEPLS